MYFFLNKKWAYFPLPWLNLTASFLEFDIFRWFRLTPRLSGCLSRDPWWDGRLVCKNIKNRKICDATIWVNKIRRIKYSLLYDKEWFKIDEKKAIRYDTIRLDADTIRYDTIRLDANTIRNDTRYDTIRYALKRQRYVSFVSFVSYRSVSHISDKYTGGRGQLTATSVWAKSA